MADQKTLELILVPLISFGGGLPIIALISYYFDHYRSDRRLLAEIRREIGEIGTARTAENNGLSRGELNKLHNERDYPFLKGFIGYLKDNLRTS